MAVQFSSLYAILPSLQSVGEAIPGFTGIVLGTGYIALVILNLKWVRNTPKSTTDEALARSVIVSCLGLVFTLMAQVPAIIIFGRALQGIGFAWHLISSRDFFYWRAQDLEGITERAGRIEQYNLLGTISGPLIGVYISQNIVLLSIVIIAPLVVFQLGKERSANSTRRQPMSFVAQGTLDFSNTLVPALLLGAALNVTVGFFEAIWSETLSLVGVNQEMIGVSFLLIGLALIIVLPKATEFLAKQKRPRFWASVALSIAPFFLFLYGVVGQPILLIVLAVIHSGIDAVSLVGVSASTVDARDHGTLIRSQGYYGATTAIAAGLAAWLASITLMDFGRVWTWVVAALLVTVLVAISGLLANKIDPTRGIQKNAGKRNTLA